MKICVFTCQYGNFWSGLGTYATNLIDGLAAAGHEVSVLCPSPDQSKADPRIRFLDCSGITLKPHMSNWLPLAWQVRRVVHQHLKTNHFDVVHFADAREGCFCGNLGDTLVAGTMNDYYFIEADTNPLHYRRFYSDWFIRWLFYNVSRIFERWAMRRLPLVIANTDYVRRSLLAHYKTDPTRTYCVYYGLSSQNADETKNAGKLEGSPSVLFVGSNFERKGLPALLNAMETVVKQCPGALLHVVGKDSKQALLMQRCQAAGIERNVRFYGGLANNQLPALYAAADIFAMPSLIEGFGLVFLEAMAVGTPVIGGRCGGTPELIRDGENGFVVAPDDSKQLAERILQLHSDPALRQRFADEGKASYAQYTVKRMVDATTALYQRFKQPSRL